MEIDQLVEEREPSVNIGDMMRLWEDTIPIRQRQDQVPVRAEDFEDRDIHEVQRMMQDQVEAQGEQLRDMQLGQEHVPIQQRRAGDERLEQIVVAAEEEINIEVSHAREEEKVIVISPDEKVQEEEERRDRHVLTDSSVNSESLQERIKRFLEKVATDEAVDEQLSSEIHMTASMEISKEHEEQEGVEIQRHQEIDVNAENMSIGRNERSIEEQKRKRGVEESTNEERSNDQRKIQVRARKLMTSVEYKKLFQA